MKGENTAKNENFVGYFFCNFAVICRVFIVFIMVFLSGCVVSPPSMPNDPYYAPVLRTNPEPDMGTHGSLYRANTSMDLFGDNKASHIGDIITVVLKENTSSSKSSNIGVVKDSDTLINSDASGAGTILGVRPGLGNIGFGTNLSAEREFKGEASADQSNRLTGEISVTVVNVYPNGTLAVRGEKWITLNRGDEYIRISGLVRSDDISPDNTVLSNKIANARISYSGTGELADSQQMGWVNRFFNSAIWPF